MRHLSLCLAATALAIGLTPAPAVAQSFRMTFMPPSATGTIETAHHATRPRPTSMAKPPRTHRDAAASAIDCAMVVPANPDIDQRMTLQHPPPDIKFSMRLIVAPPCKR